MGLRQKILSYILALVLAYALYLWGIPALINIEHRVDLIQNTVKDNFGYVIELKNPKLKMGLLPSMWVKADEFNIVNDDKSYALSIKKPIVEVSIFPFILGKCHVKYVSADSLLANVSLDKDLRLFLGQYIIVKNSKSIIDVNHIKINVQDYKLNLVDKSFNKNLNLVGDYIVVDKFIQNKLLKMSTSAVLNVDGSKSIINMDLNLRLPIDKNLVENHALFTGTVTNLNLSYLSKYISYFTNKQYKDIKGILNVEARTDKDKRKTNNYILNLTFEKFGINGKGFALPYYYNDRIEINAFVSAIGKNLNIKNINFKTKDLNVLLTGKILKNNSKNPEADLNVEILKSRAESIVELLPANNSLFKGLGFDIETLVKTKFFADVNSKLSIKGDIYEPQVNGDLKITNAYVTPYPISNGADKATINLKFAGNKLIMDVLVPAAKDQFVTVTGETALYGKKFSDILIKSTSAVDLGLAQRILMPVHKVLNFELGPVPIMDIKGKGNINLRVKGNKAEPSAFGVFNFYEGTVSFIDVHYMVLKNASGSLKFDDKNTLFTTKSAYLNGKPMSVRGTCTLHGELNFDAKTQNQQVNDLLMIVQNSPMLKDIAPFVAPIKKSSGISDFYLNLKGKVKNTDDIVIGKTINASGSLNLRNVSADIATLKLPINRLSGKIDFNNFNINFDLESLIHKSKLKISGFIKDNIADIEINSENLTPEDLITYLGKSKFVLMKQNRNNQKHGFIVFKAKYKGSFDKFDVTRLNINGSATINDLKILYVPKSIPIDIVSGNVIIKNDILAFNNVNSRIAGMPIFIKGRANNIYKKPEFNLYINAKPNQAFADIVYNKSEIYPLKLKGDINSSTYLKGNLNNFDIKSTMKLADGAKLYYLGSTVGDESKPIILTLDANIAKNNINLNSFSMDKMILSQNNKFYPSRELTMSGGLTYIPNNILFKNFKIKTLTPTDSKVFNIIFKKPFIKQGMFSSDIKINGSMAQPKIIGTLNVTDIEIPKYFTAIKNVNMNFQNKSITLNAKGQIFGKNFKVNSILDNNLKAPFVIEDLNMYLSDIDINSILKSLKTIDIENDSKLTIGANNINLDSLIIKKSTFQADTIELDNILMHDLYAKSTLSGNHILSLDEIYFKTALGKVRGTYKLNLNSDEHTANLKFNDINAAAFSNTLFNLRNQISGNIGGEMDLSCKGNTHEACLRTLSGHGGFNLQNGKLPKLGSLEYLLNAANLVKSGITGLSLNSLVDLITPLRTGEFESITGTFSLKSGICNNIQIFTTSKNLNLFITGKYNLSTLVAEMSVFGRLSKNASNVLGPIGSASLNALFNTIPGINLAQNHNGALIESINKIPGIELSNKKYRIFTVDISGDINGDDYVQSFKWVE